MTCRVLMNFDKHRPIGYLGLVTFLCLFVLKMTPNYAVMLQILIVLIFLIISQNIEFYLAL